MDIGFLDSLPIVLVYLFTFLLLFGCTELGYQIGKQWSQKRPLPKEGSSALVGVTLGLLAFLLAFVVGMASNRFDNRKELVMNDANTAETTYLRTTFLPEPYRTQARELLKEYVDLQLTSQIDSAAILEADAQGSAILAALWAIAGTVGAEHPDSEVIALFVEAVNETINVDSQRIFTIEHTRMPLTVMIGIYVIAALSLTLLGFSNGLHGSRSIFPLLISVLVFTVVLLLIVDFDRPREGLLQVNEQPLLDLQALMSEETGG